VDVSSRHDNADPLMVAKFNSETCLKRYFVARFASKFPKRSLKGERKTLKNSVGYQNTQNVMPH
jgi:hypothetical protein